MNNSYKKKNLGRTTARGRFDFYVAFTATRLGESGTMPESFGGAREWHRAYRSWAAEDRKILCRPA
ncbi:hypothetical protein CXX84_16695 [Arthrobacter sp. AFG7.2]|nr:hypothetical protein CXX84_16695 [Arthrobacter sp. AFG7.2]